MKRLLLALALIMSFPIFAQAQTAVQLSPVARQQFFNASGVPLAGGFIYTYLGGTSTPAATYTDSSGTIQNTNPIVLDSGGFATIWLANQKYKMVAFDANSTQQWTVDNVSAYNTAAQNIDLVCTSSDPAGVQGLVACRSDLGKMRFFSTIWDSVVTENDVATIANKVMALDSNTFDCTTNVAGQYPRNNGTKFVCSAIQNTDLPALLSPTTVVTSIANSATGTTTGLLVKLTGSPSTGITTTTSDISGILGPCVSGCGTTGTAQVAIGGIASCTFNNATVSGDYVVNAASGFAPGDCHDAGATYPSFGQVLGRVLSNNSPGLVPYYIFPPEIGSNTAPKVVAVQNFSSVPGANMPTTLIFTTPLSYGGGLSTTQDYRFSFYLTQGGGGSSCSGVSSLNLTLIYGVQSVTSGNLAITVSGNYIGATGPAAYLGLATTNGFVFQAPFSTPIQVSGAYTAGSSCTINPNYNVLMIVEQLTAN